MGQQQPSIGRVVHYRGPGTANGQFEPQTYPAIITATYQLKPSHLEVDLFVMSRVGHMNLTLIPFSTDPCEASHWSWPPYVPPKAQPVQLAQLDAKVIAQAMFDAYNGAGTAPWKTFDGRDVPHWFQISKEVQGKWEAAAEMARHLLERK
jgi:hypothetical protein